MKRKSDGQAQDRDTKEQRLQRRVQLNVLKIILITIIFTVITVVGALFFDILLRS